MKMMTMTTAFSLAILGVATISLTSEVQAAEGGLRSPYRRHLLDDDSECVLYENDARSKGKNEAPGYKESFWMCQFPRGQTQEQFGMLTDLIELDGLLTYHIESGGAVSGESILKAPNMIIEERLDTLEMVLRVDPEDVTIERLMETDKRHTRIHGLARGETHRKLAPKSDVKTLVVRVIDKHGNQIKYNGIPVDEGTLSSHVFTNEVSLANQMKKCSNDQFNIVPAENGTEYHIPSGFGANGEINMIKGFSGVVDVHIDVDATKVDKAVLQTKAVAAATIQHGNLSIYDIVIFCQPPGSLEKDGTPWYAYAETPGFMSFYNGEKCIHVATLMHEIGHNILHFEHSGRDGNELGDNEYGDRSGAMGHDENEVGGPKQCFNPAKSYQLKWYVNQTKSIDPSSSVGSEEFVLNGVADFKSNPEAKISLRLEVDGINDYYVGYNRAVGFNSGTREAQNEVMILRKNGTEFGPGTSWVVTTLSSNGSWSFKDWCSKGISVKLTVDGTIGESVQDAKIVVTTYDSPESEGVCGPIDARDLVPVSSNCDFEGGKLDIRIRTDRYPTETSWALVDKSSGRIVAASPPHRYVTDNNLYHEPSVLEYYCLDKDTDYIFNIMDSHGDGFLKVDGHPDLSGKADLHLNGRHIHKVRGGSSWYKQQLEFTTGNHADPAPFGFYCDNDRGKLRIELHTDDWPGEISWNIEEISSRQVVAANQFQYSLSQYTYYEPYVGEPNDINKEHSNHRFYCLDNGKRYTFNIYDSYGDGLSIYNGYARVWLNEEKIFDIGSDHKYKHVHQDFTVL